MQTVGERLDYIFKISKYTYSDISKKMNSTKSNISKIVNGTTESPRYKTLKEMCDKFNINPNFLFGYSKIPFRNTYADVIIEYISPLKERDQRVIIRNIRYLKNSFEEEDIESGKGPISNYLS